MLYKERGWNKIISFDKKGGFNKPYVLFKAKNVTDPMVRANKWMKAIYIYNYPKLYRPQLPQPLSKPIVCIEIACRVAVRAGKCA